MKKIKSIAIYYSSEVLPPPFAHHINIFIEFGPECHIQFNMTYTGRELLTMEEITEEGFSGEDDFSWKGTLSPAWEEALLTMVEENKAENKFNQDHEIIRITFRKEEAGEEHTLNSNREWIYLMQELTQACFELSGAEAPLTIRYKKIDTKNILSLSLTYLFSFRKVEIDIIKNAIKIKKSLNWDLCKTVIKEIYTPEYLPDLASDKEPQKPGIYIDPGEGVWYNVANAVGGGRKPFSPDKLESSINKMLSTLHVKV
jgi:hypothetical protein